MKIETIVMQSLSAAQNADHTLVVGMPGFVPLKDGKGGSATPNAEEDGAT